MNWIIHFLVANIITISIKNADSKLNNNVIYLFCFITHIPLDVLDKLTYHPSFETSYLNPFYIIWSFIILGSSFYVLKLSKEFEIVTAKKNFYTFGILFGVIIDLWDWVLLRIIAFWIGSDFWDVYDILGLHRLCGYINFLKHVPSLRDHKPAILFEIGLIWILWKEWRKLENNFQSKINLMLPTIDEYVTVPIDDDSEDNDNLFVV